MSNPTGSTDILIGTEFDDVLDGLIGADQMIGGKGNDTYIFDNAGDKAIEAAGEGDDLILSSASIALLANNVEEVRLLGARALEVKGNAQDSSIFGNLADNILRGGGGFDHIDGLGGDDTLFGEDGNDDLEGDDGNDTIDGGAGVDEMNGQDGDDVIVGGAGDDILNGDAGNDTLTGGAGNDRYFIDAENSSTKIIELANQGIDEINAEVTVNLGIASLLNIEKLVYFGAADLNGFGNALNNVMTGNDGKNQLTGLDGNDTLDGGLGADKLVGGKGDDTFLVDNAADLLTENIGEGKDKVIASVTFAITGNQEIEELILDKNAGNIDGTGNGSVNTITGNDGNNKLDGKGGDDTLVGGKGDDTYTLLSTDTKDKIIEAANAGIDTVIAGFTVTLGANLENLTLAVGAGVLNGTGNALANSMTANESGSKLDGGAGNDKLFSFAGFDQLIGGAGDDQLTGDGIGGNNLQGGAGNDAYFVGQFDSVVEAANAGIDSVAGDLDFDLSSGQFANFENATVNGSTARIVTGNGFANFLTGGSGADLLFGNGGDDTLVGGDGTVKDELSGGDGDDRLIGGAGADVMAGGNGNDSYLVDDAGDTVDETGVTGIDSVESNVTFDLTKSAKGQIENLTLVGIAALDGTGDKFSNKITGNSAKNTLDGGDGNDTLIGNAGNDTYIVDSLGDKVVEKANEGIDTIETTITITLGANIEKLFQTFVQNIDGTGNALDNGMQGNSGKNKLDGAGGNDSILGGQGNDTLIGGTGDDFLSGLDDDDTLIGGAGNDELRGGNNADIMIGGAGNDLYGMDAKDTVIELAGGGIDEIETLLTVFDLSAVGLENIENLTFKNLSLSAAAIGNALGNVIKGTFAADTLEGGDGNDRLDGSGDADDLFGGKGDDTYVVDDANDETIEEIGEGKDLVLASVTITLSDDIENLTLTDTGKINGSGNEADNVITGNENNNVLSGDQGNDTLIGNGGNDTLDGGEDKDTMSGGAGDDTYQVDDAGDKAIEGVNAGASDTVKSTVSFVLGANIENLTLESGNAIDGTGNALDNTIKGNDSNNVLIGGAGNDTIFGGNGLDTLDGGVGDDILSGGPSASKLLGGAGNDVLSAIAGSTLDGGAGDDKIAGSVGGDDVMTGGTGNDTLTGNNKDQLAGGAGNDIYVVLANLADVTITELANQGVDELQSGDDANLSVVQLKNIENLTLTDTVDGTGLGNALNNRITGNIGKDRLEGGAGNDTLDGGANNDDLLGGTGDDTYIVDNKTDRIVEVAKEGKDLVLASVTFTLADEVENLTLAAGFVINGTGNKADNLITGNEKDNTLTGAEGNDTLIGGDGKDTLNGGAGNDAMAGGAGDDSYAVDSAADKITEGVNAGHDTVQSSITFTLGANLEELELTGNAAIDGTGNALDNDIDGNAKDNKLSGGAGNDSLEGAGGNDTLDGGAGDDALDGGAGTDLLIGGAGNDQLESSDALDTLRGGAGDDTYVISVMPVAIEELANGGHDFIQSDVSINLSVVGVNIEDLEINSAGGPVGIGNDLDNNIQASGAANFLDGGKGNDLLQSGGGDDTLIGGDGDDTLEGEVGADTMTGGDGKDVFRYSDEFELLSDQDGDEITDFAAGEDSIDLRKVFESFDFFNKSDIVTKGFIVLDESSSPGNTVLKVDLDGTAGGGPAIALVTLTGVTNATIEDIIF